MSAHYPRTNGQQNRAGRCAFCGWRMRRKGILRHIMDKHTDRRTGVIVVPPNHPLAAREGITVNELLRESA